MNDAYAMIDLLDGPAWALVVEGIRSLKDGAVERVLHGLEPDEYRRTIGFIQALDLVEAIPGELVERGTKVRDSLHA